MAGLHAGYNVSRRRISSVYHGNLADGLHQLGTRFVTNSFLYLASTAALRADFYLDKLMRIKRLFHLSEDVLAKAALADKDNGFQGLRPAF